MPKTVRVVFTRHANRKDVNKTGITQAGARKSKAQGTKRALAGQIVKRYSSSSKRNLSTAKKAQKGYEELVGKRYKLRVRKDITTPVPNKKEWERTVREDFHGDKKAATIAWLRGKITSDIVLKPNVFVKDLIRKRVGLGKRVVRIGARDLVLESFTHQELMLGIFEMLTGERIEKLRKPLDIKYLESFEIVLFKNGNARLKIRDKTYDITQRLNRILRN